MFQNKKIDNLYKDCIKLFKFMLVGLPSFGLALVLNRTLVEYVGWNKSLAYAIVLVMQVSINFFMCRLFVFTKRSDSSLWKQFIQFLGGILFFRIADWGVYTILVEFCGLYYMAIQFLNIFIFAVLKYKYSQRIMEKR